jgi:cytochrome c oxidase subunit 3
MSIAVALDREAAARWHRRELGLWIFLGTVTMLFAAFTSALIVRRSSTDWHQVALPAIAWMNTAFLLGSSAALEAARRAADPVRRARGVAAASALGLIFVAGQVEVWRSLMRSGIYVPTTPAASFLYILTGVHAVHLLAALVALGYLFVRSRRAADPEWPLLAGVVASLWHFLTVVWIYLLAVVL